MALTHLADTTVLNRMRQPTVPQAPRAHIANLIAARVIGRCTMTDLEVGFSARNGAEWDALARSVETCPLVEVTSEHFNVALRTQRLLADAGLKGRKLPDLLIAAVAETRGLTVLHYDADYDLIANVTHQPVEWAFPPGSVD